MQTATSARKSTKMLCAGSGCSIARWGQSPTKPGKAPSTAAAGHGSCALQKGLLGAKQHHGPFSPSSSTRHCKAIVGTGENPFWKTQGGRQSLTQAHLAPGTRSIPRLTPLYLPSKALPFIIPFPRSQMIVPLRGALALSPPCFVASFSVHCIFSAASIFIDFSRWAKQHVLHLWGASFAGATGLPAIPHETGGRIRGQKDARQL